MITRITRTERENKRRLYRVNTNIPIILIPIFSENKTDNKKEKIYKSCLLDISGCGGRFVLPEDFPEVSQIIAKFKLNKFEAEIICDVVRRSEKNKTIATSFIFPCNVPNNIANPIKWLENKITHFVFSQQVVWKKDEKTVEKVKRYLAKLRLSENI